MELQILCDDSHLAVGAAEDEAPELFAAWAAWRSAARGSSRESQLWNAVIEAAQTFVDESYDDREVMDVTDETE